MFFGNKAIKKCESCGNKVNEKYSYCPYCGNIVADLKKERENYGLLGKKDEADIELNNGFNEIGNFGITDKLVNSMFNAVMKNLDKQMKAQLKESGNDFGNAEIKSFPNGVSIKISGFPMNRPRAVQKRRKEEQIINEELMQRMNSLPREEVKATMKRLGDKIIYELAAPGVISVDDVFITKTESGYEMKAVGDDKVYVCNFSVDLPLRKYSISKNKLLFEFVTQSM